MSPYVFFLMGIIALIFSACGGYASYHDMFPNMFYDDLFPKHAEKRRQYAFAGAIFTGLAGIVLIIIGILVLIC